MLLFLGSFIAGMLTVLAPCVLPLLPVIIGGSFNGNVSDRKRPIIIVAALGVSLLLFTLLLKATTLFINVPPQFFTYLSGTILVGLGLLTLFPSLYAKLIARLGIEQRAQATLSKGFKDKSTYTGPIIIGAALGPVFSSCSPVYAYILATVLPVNFAEAIVYILAYIAGLSVVLMAIGYYGQRFVRKIRFASNPKGIFQRSIAILFIIVGLLVFSGYDKRFQTWVATHTPFDFDSISASFLPEKRATNESLFNVEAYAAPEFVGLKDWINSEPRTLESLKGKVVMVDFWTYSCINCIRNNPYLIKWYEAYHDAGLEIIGMHAPEFAFERNKANVLKAVKDQGIPYPVALDNDFMTWAAYENRSWPAYYLIDSEGNVRRVHEGEGEYDKTEQAIRQLLVANGARLDNIPPVTRTDDVPVTKDQTPETYLGLVRASNFQNERALGAAPGQPFVAAENLKPNNWTLGGSWEVRDKSIVARGQSVLRFNVTAKKVFLVMGASRASTVGVTVDGKSVMSQGVAGPDVKADGVRVGDPRLYRLIDFGVFRQGVVELKVPDGVELNAFTFES